MPYMGHDILSYVLSSDAASAPASNDARQPADGSQTEPSGERNVPRKSDELLVGVGSQFPYPPPLNAASQAPENPDYSAYEFAPSDWAQMDG